MKHLQKILLLLAVVVLGTGCIKENLDDCETPVTIYFEYKADGSENVLPNYIQKIDLYVFDANNQLIDTKIYRQDELTDKGKGHAFRMKSGKYKLVAIGNAYDKTKVVGLDAGNLGQMYMQHPSWGQATPEVDGHDDNYLEEQEIEVPEFDARACEATVQLFSSHIEVQVEIKGLSLHPGAVVNGQPALNLCFENANALTNLNNQVDATAKETCKARLVYDAAEEIIHSDGLKLFRLDGDGTFTRSRCDHELVLTDAAGNELARENISNYIQQHRDNIDVTRQEAMLPIAIEFTSVGVEIKLPGWVIVDGKPEWN